MKSREVNHEKSDIQRLVMGITVTCESCTVLQKKEQLKKEHCIMEEEVVNLVSLWAFVCLMESN